MESVYMPEQNERQLIKEKLLHLASDNHDMYRNSYAWFVEQGPRIAKAITQGLDDELLGSVCHWRILLLLGHFAQEDTLPAVLKAFRRAVDRRDPIVLPGAMQALAAFHDPDATDALVSLLHNSNTDIVKQAAALVGQTGDLNAVEPLLHLLDSEDPSVRFSAVRGLTQMDNSEVRTALRHHLENETNQEVRALIISAGIEGTCKSDQ
jgi:HEAT repeat protein